MQLRVFVEVFLKKVGSIARGARGSWHARARAAGGATHGATAPDTHDMSDSQWGLAARSTHDPNTGKIRPNRLKRLLADGPPSTV